MSLVAFDEGKVASTVLMTTDRGSGGIYIELCAMTVLGHDLRSPSVSFPRMRFDWLPRDNSVPGF